ncbi:DUF5658 family protein [Clostridium sp. WILCCON 0269]|uniref:DUF5658 family protein n=1 Tax=Candidatus Clostridium eludens TaxID=3381663 RepID=A0ABW8SFB8_9CLOT
MLVFIRNYSLSNIRNKFIILCLLNISDMFFTRMLLNTGYFIEANPLMVSVVHNLKVGFWIKIVLPTVLLSFLYFRMQKAIEAQLKKSNFIINGIVLMYIAINIFHLICLAIYICMYKF